MKAVIYKQSLFTLVSLSIFSLLGIILFNYYVDPGNRFFHAALFEKEIADALLNDKKVMFHTNYNDRGVEKIFLEKLNTRPDFLVIGSSRAMPIGQELFNSSSFYNASVTSASLEDILSIYYLYQLKGQPKVLVLSLDPWILDKNHGMKKWKLAFLSEYDAARQLILGEKVKTNYAEKLNIIFEKYSQLLSSEYTHVALRKFMMPPSKEVIIDPADNACPSCYTRFPNGTRIFSSEQESTTNEQADLASIQGIQQYTRDYGTYTQLDPYYMNMLDQFVAYLLNHKVRVIFYLPAYEPIAYSAIETDDRYKMIDVAEKYFMSMADKYHLKVIGGYDPRKLKLQANDFVDDLHLKRQPIENIFKQQISIS